jgi:hypothetical protein
VFSADISLIKRTFQTNILPKLPVSIKFVTSYLNGWPQVAYQARLINQVPMETSDVKPGISALASENGESVVSKSIRKITILLSLVVLLCFAILCGAILTIFHPPQTAPNKEVIKFLEDQRQQMIKNQQAIEKVISDNREMAAARQFRDSQDLLAQSRLFQYFDNTKPLYEKNKYVFHLNTGQLRREYADFTP